MYTNEDWKEFNDNAQKYLRSNSQYATANAINLAISKQIIYGRLEISEGIEICPRCQSVLGPYGYFCCMCGQKVREGSEW